MRWAAAAIRPSATRWRARRRWDRSAWLRRPDHRRPCTGTRSAPQRVSGHTSVPGRMTGRHVRFTSPCTCAAGRRAPCACSVTDAHARTSRHGEPPVRMIRRRTQRRRKPCGGPVPERLEKRRLAHQFAQFFNRHWQRCCPSVRQTRSSRMPDGHQQRRWKRRVPAQALSGPASARPVNPGCAVSPSAASRAGRTQAPSARLRAACARRCGG